MFSVLDLFGGIANILRKKFLLLAGFVHKLVLLFRTKILRSCKRKSTRIKKQCQAESRKALEAEHEDAVLERSRLLSMQHHREEKNNCIN